MTKLKKYGPRLLEVINGFILNHNIQLECTFEEIVEYHNQKNNGGDDDPEGMDDGVTPMDDGQVRVPNSSIPN